MSWVRYSCRAEGHDQEQIAVFIREIQSSQRLVRIFYTSRLLKTAISSPRKQLHNLFRLGKSPELFLREDKRTLLLDFKNPFSSRDQ